jgi:hypothetical protein
MHEAILERQRVIRKLCFTGQLHKRKRPFQCFQPLLDLVSGEVERLRHDC